MAATVHVGLRVWVRNEHGKLCYHPLYVGAFSPAVASKVALSVDARTLAYHSSFARQHGMVDVMKWQHLSADQTHIRGLRYETREQTLAATGEGRDPCTGLAELRRGLPHRI